jgi:hypothetical protein
LFECHLIFEGGKSGSMTLITSIDPSQRPIFVDFRYGSNNQYNFLMVVIQACKRGFLTKGNINSFNPLQTNALGDCLILDNASIHSGKGMLILKVLKKYGIFY